MVQGSHVIAFGGRRIGKSHFIYARIKEAVDRGQPVQILTHDQEGISRGICEHFPGSLCELVGENIVIPHIPKGHAK